MKSLQIGNTHIVISHITHFQFTPPARSGEVEAPAHLTVYVDGEDALEFSDVEAEEGYKKLTENQESR
jgi:hypothetical protein